MKPFTGRVIGGCMIWIDSKLTVGIGGNRPEADSRPRNLRATALIGFQLIAHKFDKPLGLGRQ
jgi:hypothetical protein